MSNVLVTGGAGFIGSHLVDALIEIGRILDSLGEHVHGGKIPEHLNHEAEFIKADICDAEAVRKALDGIEVVYHEAAEVGVGQSMYEIVRILRPGGLLYMTTPHTNGLSPKLLNTKWSVIRAPEHFHLFLIKGMEMLLKSVGFSKIKIATHGFNPVGIYRIFRGGDNKNESINQSADEKQSSEGFDRVKSSDQINQWMVSGNGKKKIKDLLNSVLSTTKMGDTLKIWAGR